MSSRLYEHFSDKADYSGHDAIVVGSGIGGLTAAIMLAKAGKKVLVLERHYIPGGFMHTFRRRKGLEWDVGVHYVGGMAPGAPVRKLFDYLTGNRLDWADMGDTYDKAIFGSEEFVFPKGLDQLKQQLYARFPDETQAIDAYFLRIKKASSTGTLFFSLKAMPPLVRVLAGPFVRRLFNRQALKTTWEVLGEFTANDKLKAILCTQCGDYGLPPRESSFMAHAMVVNHFLDGAWYPVGGADKIYKHMIEVLYRHGGKVVVKADVSEIVVKNARVSGVMVNGRFIACPVVVSNTGVNNTYSHLLARHPLPALEKIARIKPSHSHMCLYVGLNDTAEALALPRHNVWYYQSHDMKAVLDKALAEAVPEIGFAYISFPSAKDSTWNSHHRPSATIQAMTVGNMEFFKAFADQPWLDRGAAYDALKQRFTDNMLDKLYELFPQLRGHVIYTEVSTPLSTRHFMNYDNGEIYGLQHTPARFALDCLTPATPVKGLFLTGQDITMVGVTAAMLSGILTAANVLKWGIWRSFRDMGKPAADQPRPADASATR